MAGESSIRRNLPTSSASLTDQFERWRRGTSLRLTNTAVIVLVGHLVGTPLPRQIYGAGRDPEMRNTDARFFDVAAEKPEMLHYGCPDQHLKEGPRHRARGEQAYEDA